MINFKVNKVDSELIGAIVDRAEKMAREVTGATPDFRMTLRMDLCAAHSARPLRLRELLATDDFNFSHDVFGISRHMDRSTGELGGHFVPRFTA